MSTTETDIVELSRRLRSLEDQQAITHLITTHPLAIDGGAGVWWLDHWTDDSVMDRTLDPERHSGDYSGVYGKDVMYEENRSPEMAALREKGICHFVTMPRIDIVGDTATATNYLQLIGLEGGSYRVRRVTISRWELVRVGDGWQVSKRIMRPLGHPDAVSLMLKQVGQE